MRRFCLSEEVLGEYITGCLPAAERPEVEKHLAECEKCRNLVLEAYRAMRIPDAGETKLVILRFLKKNLWAALAVVFLLVSFIVPRYFFQFLLISFITGLKWVSDSRHSRTVIMIQEKRDGAGEKSLDNHVSRAKDIS